VPDVAVTPLGTFAAPLYVTSLRRDPRACSWSSAAAPSGRPERRHTAHPFLDVSSEVGLGGERGLLSIAFAPDYAVSACSTPMRRSRTARS
jgi:hypothetical protein